MNPEIISESPVTIYEVEKEMKKIKKRDGELNIRTKKLEDYLNNFAVLKQKDAEALEKEIIDIKIPRLRDTHVKKIVDLLPETADELKVIFSGSPLTITKENIKKIIDLVKKYSPPVK
ncbi:MAG: hypothetical protein KKF44_08260 [Nanoarchaeota archaeon]|nr:hypothetical protein [Nanoarchaeota archaeon]